MAAGVVPTELLYAELVEMLRWYKGVRGRLGLLAGGPVATEPVMVKTTSGTADANGNYPGVVTLWSADDAAWQEYATAVKLKPPNGETLANNTRYPARPAGRTSGGDELYLLLSGSGLTGGSVDALEVDGTPNYGNRSRLLFDQADGFVLTEPAAGDVRVDIAAATASQAGVVSTTAQEFGGDKGFADCVYVEGNSGNLAGDLHLQVRTPSWGSSDYSGGLRLADPVGAGMQFAMTQLCGIFDNSSNLTGGVVGVRGYDIYFFRYDASNNKEKPIIRVWDGSAFVLTATGTITLASTSTITVQSGFITGWS